ncbi:GerAB/ArcD/ProY family transporter [Pseudoneobacillus rhizosphaerae]|uniref:Spore germination protein YndE n=1 Tax=Pseudoneobacillus rhizosphaerae TaxID=2880968 RepID=A0A9C7L9T6_9BACI|nr:GerAB/ArcD/ProY family transporter [Pseudoneobacillus rhizosphaerae]CAG9607203.1 Spore germination protein YndE [Pseudoneobacillus rhizosphaerae]
MDIQYQPKPQLLLSTFLVFFIIHDIQVGVGIQGFQRIIFLEAKQDAWISVILSGILTHMIVFIMIKTLQYYGSSDIYGIHHDIYGKWIGRMMNCLYIFYCLVTSLVILKNYIEVIQTWMFPQVPTWFLSISLLLLVVYGVTGGIRVIVGVSFFNIVLSMWMLGLIGYPIRYSDYTHFLPILESNIPAILKGTFKMTFTVIGFEILYVIYPHLKEKNKVQKFAHLAIAITTILYLLLMLLAIAYFSSGQLEKSIWVTLSLFKIVKLPFIERMEYIAIAFWMLIIIPNIMLYLWAAVRGMNRTFNINESNFIWIFSLILFISSLFLNTRMKINTFNDKFALAAFYLVYCYPIILFVFVLIKKKIKGFKEKQI